jgi:hypothetical protein
MRVVSTTTNFRKNYPKAAAEIDDIAAVQGHCNGSYSSFTMAYEDINEYPALFDYLKNCGFSIAGKETVLLEHSW